MPETQILFTHPNSDTGSTHIVAAMIHAYAEGREDCIVVPSLGKRRYFQVLKHCDCLVGNSSSGIIEAATFELPVVNIGTRQTGRIAPKSVITTPIARDAIADAWRTALSEGFRKGLARLESPYGDGQSSERIADIIASIPPSPELIRKKFVDREWNDVASTLDLRSSIEGGAPQ